MLARSAWTTLDYRRRDDRRLVLVRIRHDRRLDWRVLARSTGSSLDDGRRGDVRFVLVRRRFDRELGDATRSVRR